MAEATDKNELFLQNLRDAGCDGQTIRECLSLVGAKKDAQLLRLLAHRRMSLLDSLHKSQEQIDCLDFLVYQIKHGNIL